MRRRSSTALTQSEPEPGAALAHARRARARAEAPEGSHRRAARLRAAGRRRRAPVDRSAPAPAASTTTATTTRPASASAALTQAWLLLAQAAEQQRDFAAAERWLAKIDNPQRALEVQSRRASLLARQGKVAEARELIRRVPEQTAGRRARQAASPRRELLRDAKQWAEADKVLAQANQHVPERHRPALRAGDDGREARTASTRWSGCCAG